MGAVLKSVGVVSALAVGGGGYLAWETLHNNHIPEFLLSPADALPAEIPIESETLICAIDANPCTTQNAIGILALKSHTDVPLSDVGQFSAQAFVATEDRRFYEHEGIDVPGAARAMFTNISVRAFAQGASTIDRQLAGIIYPQATPEELANEGIVVSLSSEISDDLAQQIHEGRLALAMNEVYTKDQILEKYLNVVYFGRNAYGIQAAAQAYFGIDAKDLNLQQSAVLAALVRRPGCVDGIAEDCMRADDGSRLPAEEQINLEYAAMAEEYDRVIDDMKEVGFITAEQATTLHQTPIQLIEYRSSRRNGAPTGEFIHAQHFVDVVRRQAADILNIPPDQLATGYRIVTTLNIQDQAAMANVIFNSPLIQGNVTAAGVSIKKDGAVNAMIGGENYQESQVNIAMGRAGGGSGRDAGSVLKGFAYAYALSHGWTLDRVVHVAAEPLVLAGADNGKDWELDPGGKGCDRLGRPLPCDMTVAEAMTVSSNDVAAMIVQEFGIQAIGEKMRALGVDIQEPFVASNIIGTGNVSMFGVATGYNSLLLNDGTYVEPYFIQQIIDPQGNVVYQHATNQGEQVYDASTANLTAQGLVGVMQTGTGRGASVLSPEAFVGKTGTADNNTDVSFAGSACDNNTGGETAAITLLDPTGKIHIDATSRQAAQMVGAYMQALQGRDRNCSLLVS